MAQISLVKGGKIIKGGKKSTDPKTGKTTNQSFVATDGKVTEGRVGSVASYGDPRRVTKSSAPVTEPTIITDTTIREETIPQINDKVKKLSETGQYYDSVGNTYNADGSLAETETSDPRTTEADELNESASEDTQMIFDTLNSLRKQTDADTARQIKALKAQTDVRERQLTEINRREELSSDTSLLRGGSSRYTDSATGISAAKQREGIMELAALDAEEQAAIAELKAAQSAQNYRTAESLIEKVETLRKEKVSKAVKLAEDAATENKLLLESMKKQSRETAIASLFQQGITDPATMFTMLSEAGSDISIKEIADTLKLIDPAEDLKGLSGDYQTFAYMQKTGQIPEDWSLFDYQAAIANAKRAPTGGGYYDSDSIDWTSAKTADIKSAVKDIFPGEFGSRLILDLTDEELRDFMNYYTSETEAQQMSLDPEAALLEWSDAMGINEEEDSSFAEKLKLLFPDES